MKYLVGDIHGNIGPIHRAMSAAGFNSPQPEFICLGDVGIGMDHIPMILPPGVKFIHGNHDNPEECLKYPGYLGRFGTFDHGNLKVFFVSGATSIDAHKRIPGKSWFYNENLSHFEGMEAIQLYSDIKPDIVLSHDCPAEVLLSRGFPDNPTRILLQRMMDIHVPKAWYYGHHHRPEYNVVGGCKFRCLGIGEIVELPYEV